MGWGPGSLGAYVTDTAGVGAAADSTQWRQVEKQRDTASPMHSGHWRRGVVVVTLSTFCNK